jgi:hypothetical protein
MFMVMAFGQASAFAGRRKDYPLTIMLVITLHAGKGRKLLSVTTQIGPPHLHEASMPMVGLFSRPDSAAESYLVESSNTPSFLAASTFQMMTLLGRASAEGDR